MWQILYESHGGVTTDKHLKTLLLPWEKREAWQRILTESLEQKKLQGIPDTWTSAPTG